MLTDISHLNRQLSDGQLVHSIVNNKTPCSLLRVIFPKHIESGNPHGLAYLDFGDPDRLLRLQPGTHIDVSMWTSMGNFGKSAISYTQIRGPVLISIVERVDAVFQTMMADAIWTDDEDDTSSHPVAWGVYLAISEKSKIPASALIKKYKFDTLGSISGHVEVCVQV